MTAPGFKSKGDFMTMLLQDDLFKGQNDYIVDECLTFMGAASQTTALLMANALFYLTQNKDKT
jgi:cytochrome P450